MRTHRAINTYRYSHCMRTHIYTSIYSLRLIFTELNHFPPPTNSIISDNVFKQQPLQLRTNSLPWLRPLSLHLVFYLYFTARPIANLQLF